MNVAAVAAIVAAVEANVAAVAANVAAVVARRPPASHGRCDGAGNDVWRHQMA